MRAARRSAATVLAIDAVALILVLASVPAAWLWLDGRAGPSPTPSVASPSTSATPPTGPSPSATPTVPPPTPSPVYGNGTWAKAGSLPRTVWASGSAVLGDGRVLVVGGSSGTSSSAAVGYAELFDPRSGHWTVTTEMLQARAYPTAVALPDGSALVVGGSLHGAPLDTTERYYPGSGAWVAAGRMHVARTHTTATLLHDGRVLVVGGGAVGSPSFATTNRVDLYDPETGTWTEAASMSVARGLHTATLLPDGRVLVAGGSSKTYGTKGVVTAAAEIYDPATDAWHTVAPMAVKRYVHSAAILPDGRVLVAGGWSYTGSTDPSLSTAEIFDPASNSWSATASMAGGRAEYRLAILRDGRVLVAGGVTPNYKTIATAEIYDPETGSWSATGKLAVAVMWPVLAVLPDGRVLVAGGAMDTQARHMTNTCAIYTPAAR
jgi:N-acetylneuraminic acid mutarotase